MLPWQLGWVLWIQKAKASREKKDSSSKETVRCSLLQQQAWEGERIPIRLGQCEGAYSLLHNSFEYHGNRYNPQCNQSKHQYCLAVCPLAWICRTCEGPVKKHDNVHNRNSQNDKCDHPIAHTYRALFIVVTHWKKGVADDLLGGANAQGMYFWACI